MQATRHFGIYCIARLENRFLFVRKADGPYQDQFCLPGGTPQHGEDAEATLQREALEEIGTGVQRSSGWMRLSFRVEADSRGNLIDHLHDALVCFGRLPKPPDLSISCLDVRGSKLFEFDEIAAKDGFSPLVVELARRLWHRNVIG